MALVDSQGEYFVKKSDEILDFTINWAAALGTDIISNSTWSVPSGITQTDATSDNTTTTLWLSGGTAGNEYPCVNTIETAGTRTLLQTLRIKVVPPAALDSSALIDLSTFKQLSGISDNLPDSDPSNGLYKNLIEAASSEIIGYCGRNFKQASYIEPIYTDQARDGVVLKEFPVAYIESVHDSVANAILLTNSASNAVSARAWVAPDRKLYLQVVGGASNGIQSIDLTAAATDTLGELVTAINTLGYGWAAGLASGASGYEPCEYLIELAGSPVPASGLYLQHLGPVITGNYYYDSTSGILKVLYSGCNGSSPSLWVKYLAGYATIPADLQLLTARYALALQGELSRDPGLDSERIGDYSYTRSGTGVNTSPLLALEGQLRNWKSKAV